MSAGLRAGIGAAVGAAVLVTSGVASASVPDGSSSAAPSDVVAGRVLVHYADGTSPSDQADLERGQSATRVGSVAALGVAVLSVPDGAEDRVISALTRSGKVDYAEHDGVAQAAAVSSGVTPNDTYWSSQWGPAKINAPAAWGTTTGSSSVLVADVDTGADLSHPDLQGKLVSGYDYVNNDSNPTDDNGHGTATAGIIAASTNNGSGIAGMCWQCRVMPVKALNSSGSGSYSAIANAITYAADHGAQIINLSLGGSSDSTTLHNAVTYAHNKGIVLVAAAGNNGTTAYNYPGAFPETLSVSGTTSTDKLYSWSSYGSWVDVAAPGCDYATSMGGSYNSSFCGTSAATPVVSGLVGLLKSYQPSASASTLESAVESTAVDIGSVVQDGRVDAAAAMAAMGSSAPAPAPGGTTTETFSGNLNNKNSSRSYSVTVGTGTLSAELTFSRGSDLTLQVVDSAGTVVSSSSGGSPVTTSASVSSGTYRVVVSGSSRTSFTLTVTHPAP